MIMNLNNAVQWLELRNEDLFSDMELPEGIDRNVLIDNILIEGGEFECLYQNPYYVKHQITVWSKKHKRTFEKWINVFNIEYNPLENYDRVEDIVTTDHGVSKNRLGSTVTTDGTGTNKISGFNSDELRDNTQNIMHNTVTGSGADEVENDNTNKRIARIHGNIGVTTSQQMAQSEIDLARFNIIQEITNIFLDEIVIKVY